MSHLVFSSMLFEDARLAVFTSQPLLWEKLRVEILNMAGASNFMEQGSKLSFRYQGFGCVVSFCHRPEHRLAHIVFSFQKSRRGMCKPSATLYLLRKLVDRVVYASLHEAHKNLVGQGG